MSSMLKRTTIPLAAVSALLLVACGSGSGTGQAASGGSAGAVAVGREGVQADIQDVAKFCGTKPIKVALADGFGGNSWRKTTRALFEAEAKKCSNITSVLYTDAQADPQKAIADINGLVAQGVNVIVSFADAGEALLPTVQAASAAGVKFVSIVACPGGTPGEDYVDCVSENVDTYGYGLANWTIKKMGGKGKLVMTGGQAGNPYSAAVYKGVKRAAAENPGITILNQQMGDVPVDTSWEPGKTKQVMAGLITKFGQIDGVVADYGGGSVGGIEAFLESGRRLPVWSANDSNQFACLYHENKDRQPTFQIATMSSRNWVVVPALHKGLAAYNGITNDEPSTYNLDIIEDSTDQAKQPKCEKSLPNDAILSSGLSVAQLQALFKQ
ncbi:substrate-binding domain-containing protein [Micromonospora sp. WMMD558]|uniref:substrate-binding domain-containing protein n=1 Tax=Micromonospora sp. WMMD558 TaxID=3403462 RepID=UPI003BF51B2C